LFAFLKNKNKIEKLAACKKYESFLFQQNEIEKLFYNRSNNFIRATKLIVFKNKIRVQINRQRLDFMSTISTNF